MVTGNYHNGIITIMVIVIMARVFRIHSFFPRLPDNLDWLLTKFIDLIDLIFSHHHIYHHQKKGIYLTWIKAVSILLLSDSLGGACLLSKKYIFHHFPSLDMETNMPCVPGRSPYMQLKIGQYITHIGRKVIHSFPWIERGPRVLWM